MIGVATDLPELRERFAKGSQWVRGGSVSPSGARAVIGFRGEIVTVPAEKGDPRNLTQTPAVHERYPAWSPDGKSIAYFSDASGEYELHVAPQDGKGAAKVFKLAGSGFYASPSWSPDCRKIAFADNSLTLYWLDLGTGAVKRIAQEYLYQPGGQAQMRTSWSPDSRWIAYTLGTPTFFRRVHVYSVDQDKSFAVTDGLSSVEEPTFDAEGKYLWFLGSTDAGPASQWFDMSNADMRLTSSLYLAVLRKDLPNPLAKESDEEKPKDEKKEADKPAAKPGDKPAAPAGQARGGRPHRLRRARHAHRRRPRRGRRLRQPPGRRGRQALLSQGRPAADADLGRAGRFGHPRLRPRDAQGRGLRAGLRRLRADGGPQEDARRLPRRVEHHPDGRQSPSRARASSISTPSASASSPRPSGSRSSTRPGASTGITSTIRATTARTGRP